MTEKEIHRTICQYLKAQYPKVLFTTDLSGIKLTIGQAAQLKNLRSGRGWPDIFIAERNDISNGLFLEVKKNHSQVYLKNGNYTSDVHILEQIEMHSELKKRGYKCVFVFSFEDAKIKIDNYFKNIKL